MLPKAAKTSEEVKLREGQDRMAAVTTVQGRASSSLASTKANAEGEVKTLEVCISKTRADDKLGLDVKHIDGKLVVSLILDYGAVERTNAKNRAQVPPKETLQVGD